MDETTAPLPRVCDLQLPSIRSLDLHLDPEGRRNITDPTMIPAHILVHHVNPYPAYPLHGDNRLTDPSQNAFVNSGFHSSGVFHLPKLGIEGAPASNLTTDPEAWALHRPVSLNGPRYDLPFLLRRPELVFTDQETDSTSTLPPTFSPPYPTPTGLRMMRTTPTPGQHSGPRNLAAIPSKRAGKRVIIVSFSEVIAHTAKCDECNRRNKGGMTRCISCGWQCCLKCLNDRAGDRSHRYFTGMHTPESGEPQGKQDQNLVQKKIDGDANGNGTVSVKRSREAADLAIFTPSKRRALNQDQRWLGGAQGRVRSREENSVLQTQQLQHTHRAQSHDSEETLSWYSQSGGEDVVEGIGVNVVRRNPSRAARPSDAMMTDDSA